MGIGKYFIRAMIAASLGIGAAQFAYADGSVSFALDIIPMMKGRPIFEQFIAQSFSITDTGWGIRIDSPTIPHMGGARIGPYRFNAIWHSPKGDVPVTLIIDTKTQFFDAHHREITGDDLREATSITETLDSIEIESPKGN
ncbi:hypothetical protein [Paraburkholderia susongensis]|uniref:hypothetical protein n=1 Tax=Paraburkholderia susongensis TaxID=1515439 RepID=UPI00117CF01A|nr:hypothetical protein [Paraburkholderia susongensis]